MPEKMPFRKGDIIVYVKHENGVTMERDVLVFDGFDGDIIKAKAALITIEGWDVTRITEAEASRQWEDGCKLRYALSYEMRAFIRALLKRPS